MTERNLSKGQAAEIEKLKRQWMDEAEPYLKNTSSGGAGLDGPDSVALAKIQAKYKKRIEEAMKASK